MKKLHHSLKELTQEEYTLINGGESGWYYLGKAARWVVDTAKACAGAYGERLAVHATSSNGGKYGGAFHY
jgi:hypothetical protein